MSVTTLFACVIVLVLFTATQQAPTSKDERIQRKYDRALIHLLRSVLEQDNRKTTKRRVETCKSPENDEGTLDTNADGKWTVTIGGALNICFGVTCSEDNGNGIEQESYDDMLDAGYECKTEGPRCYTRDMAEMCELTYFD